MNTSGGGRERKTPDGHEYRSRPSNLVSIDGICRTLLAALLVTGNLAGCGESGSRSVVTFPVQGRVLLPNGSPLTSGRVAFVPKDVQRPPASGQIGPDGNFTLTTRTEGDGAAAGDYKIRIEPDSIVGQGRRHRKLGFPIKYVDEDSSGLSITVRTEPNQLAPIRLK